MMKHAVIKTLFFFVIIFIISCGSLGHIEFYYYDAPKYEVEKDLLNVIHVFGHDSIPIKWKEYIGSMDFLDEKFIYFNNNPEEIYRVGFIGDSSKWNQDKSSTIGIYGVFKDNAWQFEKDLTSKEKKRMKKRFENEILSKMSHQYK